MVRPSVGIRSHYRGTTKRAPAIHTAFAHEMCDAEHKGSADCGRPLTVPVCELTGKDRVLCSPIQPRNLPNAAELSHSFVSPLELATRFVPGNRRHPARRLQLEAGATQTIPPNNTRAPQRPRRPNATGLHRRACERCSARSANCPVRPWRFMVGTAFQEPTVDEDSS
jgi:hypothetical protein